VTATPEFTELRTKPDQCAPERIVGILRDAGGNPVAWFRRQNDPCHEIILYPSAGVNEILCGVQDKLYSSWFSDMMSMSGRGVNCAATLHFDWLRTALNRRLTSQP
jgi:hypothetical protein